MNLKEYQEEISRVSKADIEYERIRQRKISRVLLWAKIQKLLLNIRGGIDV